MRIDFHYGPHSVADSSRANTQNSAGAARSVNSSQSGEDQAELSGAHVEVAALVAQASQLPEIREERIQALREAVASGHYQVDAQKTARAMAGHMVIGPTA